MSTIEVLRNFPILFLFEPNPSVPLDMDLIKVEKVVVIKLICQKIKLIIAKVRKLKKLWLQERPFLDDLALLLFQHENMADSDEVEVFPSPDFENKSKFMEILRI